MALVYPYQGETRWSDHKAMDLAPLLPTFYFSLLPRVLRVTQSDLVRFEDQLGLHGLEIRDADVSFTLRAKCVAIDVLLRRLDRQVIQRSGWPRWA